jgi:hypothetical protein
MRRAGRESDDQREVTQEHIRREPLPSGRAILWKPLPDSYHLLASMMRTTEEKAHLFVTQRAFLQVERHLRSAPDLELGGFLAGELYECPRAQVRYSVVNAVVPFADVTGDPIGSRVTQSGFDTVRKRLEAHRLSLIGWYRNGSGLGLQLLPDDVETHLTYFDQPWQTAMLVVPDPAKSKGAFFTYDARVGRSYCIPFYELFTNAVEGNGLGRTCVSWTTYVPAAPVEPLAVSDKEIVEATVMPMRSPAPAPAPPEPLDEWWDAIKDPWVRLKDVAASATRRDVTLPLMHESEVRAPDLIPTPLKPPKRPPVPAEDRRPPDELEASPRPAAAAQQKQAPRAEPTRPAPPFVGPFVGPSRPAAPRPAPARPAPARPVAARPAPARPAPQPRPAKAASSPPPPAVALPPNFHDDAIRWGRRRRIGLAVAGASFLAAIALSTVRSRSQTVAQAATNVASSAATVSSIAPPSDNGYAPISLPISLTSAVDSLSGALAYYRDIESDHREGLVGCRVLDRAYTLVGRARGRLDSTRRQVAGQLSDADSIRVSMLGAEYTYVAQTYHRSGCQS